MAYLCPLQLHSNFCDLVVINIVKKDNSHFLICHKTQDALLCVLLLLIQTIGKKQLFFPLVQGIMFLYMCIWNIV